MSATLQCLSSGSAGNNYILDMNGEKLILELGVPFKETLKNQNFDLSGVVGCLLSHIHGDHSKGIKDALSYGLQVYAPREVCDKYPKCHRVNNLKRYQIGGFIVMPLRVPHGACEECFAYHITMPDGQTLLFATDLERFPFSIKGITHLMLECNYSNELILDSLVNGDILRSQSQNHMEMEECISTVKRLRHGGLQSVILVHLSNGLSDVNMFKERFKSELGIDVEIAENNTRFILNKDDF